MVLRPMASKAHPDAARVINFLKGHPSPSLLPAALLSEASQRILSDPSTATPALLYGPDEGYPPLRRSLAGWINDFYGDARRSYATQQDTDTEGASDSDSAAEAEHITITGGASQSLGVLLSTFTDAEYTQTVWMAVPAYYLAFKIFQDAGFAGRMMPVPEDDEGVDVTFLRRQLEQLKADGKGSDSHWKGHKPASVYEKVYRHVVYVVPTYANPSSRTMSLKRREELVCVAREFDALVVCDDVYDMLQWPRGDERDVHAEKAQMPRVVDVDRYLAPRPGKESFGNVVSNGSFSKILGPGMRSGWVDASPKFSFRLSQTGVQKSGGAPNQFAGICISDLLERGRLQHHVHSTLRPSYERRWRLMRRAIAEHLETLGVSVVEQTPGEGSSGLAGGYFIWITLPMPLHSEVVVQEALLAGLVVASGESFEIPRLAEEVETKASPTKFNDSLRLCFAYEEEDLLREGVRRLAGVITDLTDLRPYMQPG